MTRDEARRIAEKYQIIFPWMPAAHQEAILDALEDLLLVICSLRVSLDELEAAGLAASCTTRNGEDDEN